MTNQAFAQDAFLQALIEDRTLVSVFMINGIRLSGQIAGFDRHVVLLDALSGLQMVFKHAISTVMPGAVNGTPRQGAHEAANRRVVRPQRIGGV